jgi:type I restriction enzyme M protein
VIMINPPFGGEEEPGVLNNFPEGLRTAETALLFVQHVMAMLKRPSGRCGIVLPNGFLFGGGIAAEVKKELLSRFNLHTIVRLPNGVFEPYTPIPTNLLFFDACEPDVEHSCTREIWYYEIPLPDGRKSYTKTNPLQWEEFSPCLAWWDNREENSWAWRVPTEEIAQDAFNLDRKNPHGQRDLAHLPPEQLIEGVLGTELRIVELMHEIRRALDVDPYRLSSASFGATSDD